MQVRLQRLANNAAGKGDLKILVFALLHQSFEQYAKGLGESLKQEWSKIQGRFEEIPFLENEEQTLRVVGAAIRNEMSQSQATEIYSKIAEISKTLKSLGALPVAMDEDGACKLFSDCYPLHPVTALILPSLCQKSSQNDIFHFFLARANINTLF